MSILIATVYWNRALNYTLLVFAAKNTQKDFVGRTDRAQEAKLSLG